MRAKLSSAEIKEFWATQASNHGQSHSASWSDRGAIDLEVREITKRLMDGDRVLDVGCANGYSTVQFATARRISIRGLDYIPKMVEEANKRARTLEGILGGDIEFAVGDVTVLKERTDAYDKVVVVRVIINLADWEQQQLGLRECARVLKPGGLLLLSEASLQGWTCLNQFRAEWELPPIPMPPFNLYLDEEKVVQTLSQQMELVELCDFASSYYVGTRVLKPLVAKALGLDDKVPNPEMHWNQWFSQLPAAGNYGTQKLFVFKKR